MDIRKMNELVKWIIKLIESKETNRNNFFDDFIEPFFIEVELMTSKYLDLFKSDSIDELNKIRNEYIQSREKIVALKNVYEKHEDPDVKRLLTSVDELFFSKKLENKYHSIGRNYIEIITRLHMNKDFKDRIRDEMVSEHLSKWNEVVRYYGEIKYKYKQPIKI